ncbi:uncharacterized protein LOC110924695 [Helianthus annuus]|uniref:uncharacterized protein LOC110924695 n=1 Tax=Helianthus annuus TaxID=4232 RepID=UPI000B902A6E|nr:uncharacterized protein LOC110924695 [Helianthus annuus]
MERNRDPGLEDLGFQSFSERLHGDVFIRASEPKVVGIPDPLGKSSLFGKPINIDGNPILPRRGSTNVINVIDELEKITVPVQPEGNNMGGREDMNVFRSSLNSYADKVKNSVHTKKEVNFRWMEATETCKDADVVIPREVIRKVQDKFENVLYGYFLGNRLPFPVVEYYAKNVWARHGFSKIMMNAEGFFFFKFDSKEGMSQVLENGPWLIRKVPLFLNVWTPSVSLRKEGIKTVPVWVKLHNVPIAVYTDDGLSLLASKLGSPKRLDGYTADMCLDNWGRSSFARALIELNADSEIKEYVTVAIPKLDEDGYVTEKIKVEYEWKPHRCSGCCVFGHNDQTCPKNANNKKEKQVVVDEDGFVTDKRRTARFGVMPRKQKQKFLYRPKVVNVGASSSGTSHDKPEVVKAGTSKSDKKEEGPGGKHTENVNTRNSFEALATDEGEVIVDAVGIHKEERANMKKGNGKNTQTEEEVVEKLPTEMSSFMRHDQRKGSEGASTPGPIAVCGILESHVDITKLDKVCKAVFRSWSWTSNGVLCDRGTRIILGWNEDVVDLMVLSQLDQVIHTQIRLKSENKSFFCSFVYAKNTYQERRPLWDNLCRHKALCHDKPWVVMGDFNVALHVNDSLYGSSACSIGMREFHDCVQYAELLDIKGHGLHYTWSQKPRNGVGLLKKIDRVMGNVKYLEMYPEAFVLYHPFRVSDHTPCILKMSNTVRVRPKPFKLANFITSKPEFTLYVEQEWKRSVDGFTMFSVTQKLRNLKPSMRKILAMQGNLHVKVSDLRKKLDGLQELIDANPLDVDLRTREAECLNEFRIASYDEECFLKQKAKVEWLCAGDSNTSFFHNMVKCRNARSRIQSIRDVVGNRFNGDDVPNALVDHYEKFLGREDHVSKLDMDVFRNVMTTNAAEHMVRQVTREEIKTAMFSIGENKAPGPDGYTSAFFKKAWDIVGTEVSNAILEFFENGKLLRQLNHTILALIPKVDTPDSVLDYRPISCCNVLYKCISKIITERIKGSLGELVSINQSAFVPGRKISDNILLTQELMHNYHLNRGPARCAFKIDIQKAYDTVSWSFLEDVLNGFGFHSKMVTWIMACVSSASYSISINGNLHGYFRGRRGLRQGDPMSPYLFTLVMEVLSLLLQHGARSSSAFKFHAHCVKQRIINVSFADDLFIFVHADLFSVKKVRDGLENFTKVSGLVPSPAKSTAYFCNVPQSVKCEILHIMPFREGNLPVRYLGVPLNTTKLMFKDCKPLVDRMEKRIDSWLNKSLSFAGRLQLINSVLSAMHIYWASVFIIPTRVTHDLEKLMRRFLWNAHSQGRVKAKVAWSDVCLPKDEGGLGIRSISDVNKALMTNHLWSIITERKSLWVQWIHLHKLKGRSIWDIQARGSVSWGWRKILSIRDAVRPFIWKIVRSGSKINAWSDNWCQFSPLNSFITPRSIANAGFTITTSLAELMDENGQWKWPSAWYDIYPVLIGLNAPTLTHNLDDRTIWKDLEGNSRPFGSMEVWHNIRHREQPVSWVNGVWFSQCIPRHSFHLWLVIKNKLKTQDRLASWEAGSDYNLRLMCCPLCKHDRDSRDHLFFSCSFASQVWYNVKDLLNMGDVNDSWQSIMNWMDQKANSRKTDHIVGKLVIAAASYYIWHERNNCLFSNKVANVNAVCDKIKNTVRLRLMGFKFKDGSHNQSIQEKWKLIPSDEDKDPG